MVVWRGQNNPEFHTKNRSKNRINIRRDHVFNRPEHYRRVVDMVRGIRDHREIDRDQRAWDRDPQ